MYTVAKGGVVGTRWTLYNPALNTLADPDEYPEGPRFTVYDVDQVTPITGLDNILFTLRRELGIYSMNLIIPLNNVTLPVTAPGAFYTVGIAAGTATKDGVDLVNSFGSPPTFQFQVMEGATEYSSERFYASAADLMELYGITDVTDQEVRFAQGLCDDWMKRTLWPDLYERERYPVPQDRNVIMLHHRPIIRIHGGLATDPAGAQGVMGRMAYGRRDRRTINALGGSFLSIQALMGSPSKFIAIRPEEVEFHPLTGECWLPSTPFMHNYTQVELTYEAGFHRIPDRAKRALAQTIAYSRLKGFGPLMQWSVGKVSHSTNSDDLLAPEVKRMLTPYAVKLWT